MLLQVQKSNAIFSYKTALYLSELTDRVPHYIDGTWPWGTKLQQIKKRKSQCTVSFYSADEIILEAATNDNYLLSGIYDGEKFLLGKNIRISGRKFEVIAVLMLLQPRMWAKPIRCERIIT